MARILVAEDDELQSRVISWYLEREGHEVVTVSTGGEALAVATRDSLRLAVLDVMLPGMDGLQVLRRIRDHDDTLPVLMLTARSTENDLLLGLELGADDYMTKPYSPRELTARVRTLLRRGPRDAPETVRAQGIELDLRRRRTIVRGTEVELTRAEFDLTLHLASNPGAVFTRAQLLAGLHGTDLFYTERTIDVHIKNLRAKLEERPRAPRLILTVRGVGYRFADDMR